MPDNRKELIKYRLESAREQADRAKEFLKEIEEFLKAENE